jgi:hypothetical protein
MADSSDSSWICSDFDIVASSKAFPQDVEAPDGNVSKRKKQKISFNFLKIKRKRGRPKKAGGREKAKPKRGRPRSQPTMDPLLLASSKPSLPLLVKPNVALF